MFVRASDGKLVIKSWHAQLRSAGGVAGTQQLTINGIAQPQGVISLEALEWAFPMEEATATETQISGSSSTVTKGAVGPMQPGGAQGLAACNWQFSRGVVSATQNPGGTQSGPAQRISIQNQPVGGQKLPAALKPSFTQTGGVSGVSGEFATTVPLYLTGSNTHWVNGTTVADMGGAGVTASVAVTDDTHATVDATANPQDPQFQSSARTLTLPTGREVVSGPGLNVDAPAYWRNVPKPGGAGAAELSN